MRKRAREIFRQGFFRSVSILVGGTAFAQLLAVLVLPLLSRIYSPEDFSVLAVYSSVLGVLSVAACLRFDIAIPLPEQDADGKNLLLLALLCSLCTAGILLPFFLIFPDEISKIISQPKLRPYFWLIPLGVWLGSSYSALQFWATRKKRFETIAKTRFSQAIGGSGTQVALGWYGALPLGLIIGQIVNVGAGIFGLARTAFRKDSNALKAVNSAELKRLAKKYDRFPKYSTLESIANTAGIQIPIVIIASLAIGPEAGYLMLITRAMQAPIGLIGGAVSQVYLSRAPDELRNGTLSDFTISTFAGLLRSGVGPLIFAGILAPKAFPIVFGAQWERSGDIALWMTPWFIMQFISSPISMVMHVRGWQRSMLALTSIGLLCRIGITIAVANYDQSMLTESYAISGAVFYSGCFFVFCRAADISISKVARKVLNALPILSSWILIALVIRYYLEASWL